MKFNNNILFKVGLGLLFILTALFIVLTGKQKPENENEKKIHVIIDRIFTCPDKEMIELKNNMFADTFSISAKVPSDKVIEFISEDIEKKLIETYTPYISDRWYDSFVKHFMFEFIIYSTAAGYESKVNHIKITQSETIPTNYSFIIYLTYGPTEGEKKDIEIKGSAQISEEDGKVSYIRFFTSRDFILEMRNAM